MKKNIAKVFILIMAFGSFIFMAVSAAPIVELASPRVETPKIVPDNGPAPKNVSAPKPTDKDKAKKVAPKKIKRIVHKKPKPIIVNYDKVSKMIEYGYYDEADAILQGAMSRSSKDVKAQALWTVSLAKQSKLDPAQDALNYLLKRYPDNSNLHYAQGVVYYQRTTSSNMTYRNNAEKLLDSAQKEFSKAVSLDKSNARAINALGVISVRQNKYKDAKNYFKKALDADKTYSIAIDNLGTMDYIDGKYSDAEKKFTKALSFNTQNTTAMYHLAQLAIRKGDYNVALKYLNDALAINPNSPAIYNLMGKSYIAQGNEAAAINAFKKSIGVKPEFVLSYLDLADIYAKRGDGEFAIEQLKTALSIDPNYYDAKLKLGDISVENAKYSQAVNVYSELVGIDGYNDLALKGLANAYYGQAQVSSNKALLGSNKDLFKALDSINKAIAANNQDLELHLAKLRLTKITNQPEESKIVLNKIIQSPANDLMSLVVKGEAYITLNDYKNAEKTFNSAVKLSTNIEDSLYLSEILMYNKQYDSAEKVLKNVLLSDAKNQQALSDMDYIQKSRKYAENYFKSAQYFLTFKNNTMAMEYLSRSLALNPNNAKAHLLLAQLYEKQKNYQAALSNYKAYASLETNTAAANRVQWKIKKLNNRL